MTIRELSPAQIAELGRYRFDRMVEKHEGPWDWDAELRLGEPEFFRCGDHDVLLPIDRDNHRNLTVLRCIPSADGDVLTLFLQDTTHSTDIDSGFLAICERVAGEPWFIATVYHEWYLSTYLRPAP